MLRAPQGRLLPRRAPRHIFAQRGAEDVEIFHGASTPGDLGHVGDPHAIKFNNQWFMFFGGEDVPSSEIRLYQATLPAGTDIDAPAASWTINETPLFTLTAGQFDETHAETPYFIEMEDGALRVYYTGSEDTGTLGTDPWAISFAEWDGDEWVRHGSAVLQGTEAWELYTGVGTVINPSVVFHNGLYHMFYQAGENFHIGYANSADGVTWANKAQLWSTNLVLWTPKIHKIGNHYEMTVASLDNGTVKQTNGIYRMRSLTPSSNLSDWGGLAGLQQIHATDDGSLYHGHWAYGACLAENRNKDVICFATGRDVRTGTTEFNIFRFKTLPMPGVES